MSKNLIQKIVQLIKSQHGKISFYDYMQAVLYDPTGGYYTAHIAPIGKKGDFITAPELSPLFGQCIARSISGLLKKFPQPVIVECGGGTGSLAKSILEYCENNKIEIAQYIIVDISEPLKKIQQEKLKKYSYISWVDSLHKIQSISGVIIANEFFDALPVRKFMYHSHEKRLLEYGVKLNASNEDENFFEWCLAPATSRMQKDLKFLQTFALPEIYESEYHPDIPSVIQNFSKLLEEGAALIIDYGYSRKELYHPDRAKGSLRGYFQHHSNSDPFFKPGFQDLTTHVDFTSIAEAAFEAGFEISGFTNQAAFLISLGIGEMCQSYEDNQAVKLLTLPQEMGEITKVMGLTKNIDILPVGFELQDRRFVL